MTYRPMLSIIIPVYNTDKFLSACLDSIVNQEQDGYEVIIVDDGSTDESLHVAKSYESRYEFISVVSQKNQGVSAARNRGMSVAKGQYIWFVDSDDLVINGSLSTIFRQLRGGADIISFAVRKIAEKEELKGVTQDSIEFIRLASAIDLLARKNSQPALYCNIFRVELIEGCRLDTTLINNEDIDFTLGAVLLAKNVLFVDTPLYLYRQRRNSATSEFTSKRINDSLRVIDKYVETASTLEGKKSRSLLSYIAYLYVVVLGSHVLVGEHDSSVLEKLKSQAWLLRYGEGVRYVVIRFIYRVFGLRSLANMLGLLIRIKGRNK